MEYGSKGENKHSLTPQHPYFSPPAGYILLWKVR